MGTHVDHIQENKSQAVANEAPQIQSAEEATFQFEDKRPESIQLAKWQGMANGSSQNGRHSITNLEFVDNRPETIVFQKMQKMANSSPKVSQLMVFQHLANEKGHTHQVAQFQQIADNHFATKQPAQQKDEPVRSAKKNDTGLPDNLKTGVEQLSGISLDDVRVHRNSDKPAQLQAHAYAQGTDIHLGAGQEKHLPHEAWHVVQQKQGRVKPTMQMKEKVNVNDDPGLEHEADVMGNNALQFAKNTNHSLLSSNLQHDTVIQRLEVITTEVERKRFEELYVMSLTAVSNYCEQQADWGKALNDDEFHFVFSLLQFLKEKNGLAICGRFILGDIHGSLGGVIADIHELYTVLNAALLDTQQSTTGFLRQIQTPELFSSFDVFAEAFKKLPEFNQRVPAEVKATMFGDVFAVMCMENKLDMFYQYIALGINPVFQNEKDSAFFMQHADTYLAMATGSQLQARGLIRNFHRFDPAVLLLLENNASNTGRAKPLVLVIYTSEDASGGFVHKSAMPAVVSSPMNHTILIEGAATLGGFTALIDYVAATYGQNNKIAQTLICAHGHTQELDLTGDPEERVSSATNQAATRVFILNLLTKMDDSAASRLVFSACEVNSIVMPSNYDDFGSLKGWLDNDADGLLKFFNQNQSLVAYVKQLASEAGSSAQVLGANASIKSDSQHLIDIGTGSLDLVSDTDPAMTAPKLVYCEMGRMLDGTLNAFAYCLVNDKKATMTAVGSRIQAKPQAETLDDIFILSFYSWVITLGKKVAKNDNIGAILSQVAFLPKVCRKFRSMLGSGAMEFSPAEIQNCFFNPENPPLWHERFMPIFINSQLYASRPIQRLGICQMLMGSVPSFRRRCINELANMTCSDTEQMLSWPLLNPLLETILPEGGLSLHGRLVLAISGLAEGNETCSQFLQDLLVEEVFPEQVAGMVTACTAGYIHFNDAQAVLNRLLGNDGPVMLELNLAFDDEKGGNVQVEGGAQNTVYVRSIQTTGHFNKETVTLHKVPEAAYRNEGSGEDEETQFDNAEAPVIYVIGQTEHNYAIRHPDTGATYFVSQADLDQGNWQEPQGIDLSNLQGPEPEAHAMALFEGEVLYREPDVSLEAAFGILELPFQPVIRLPQLKKQFHRLALKHHPDKNRDNIEEATEMFKRIQGAFKRIKDGDDKGEIELITQ